MVAARTPNISHTLKAAPKAKRPKTVRSKCSARARASWQAKLRPDLSPQLVQDKRRGGTLLLPTPLLVGETVASIPRGRVMTFSQLRRALAERFQADATCPLMTGIFATTLAGVVAEELSAERTPSWPIWRLVRDDGTLHPKWPLDALYRASMLRQEGVRLTRRNGHWAAIDTQHC
jgi:alkylated DNA nucleotide flippase Atl1